MCLSNRIHKTKIKKDNSQGLHKGSCGVELLGKTDLCITFLWWLLCNISNNKKYVWNRKIHLQKNKQAEKLVWMSVEQSNVIGGMHISWKSTKYIDLLYSTVSNRTFLTIVNACNTVAKPKQYFEKKMIYTIIHLFTSAMLIWMEAWSFAPIILLLAELQKLKTFFF